MSGSSRRFARRDAPEPSARQDAERLLTLARDCASAGIERRCLMLHLSELPPDLARPHHLRLAREAIEPLLTADRALLFELPNRDLAVVWRGSATAALAATQDALGRLFADFPPDMLDPASLSVLLDLPGQFERLAQLVGAGIAATERPPDTPAPVMKPMDVASLTRVEAALARADMARFARREQVWALTPDGSLTPAWERRILSVDELTTELAPALAARADPWLFARLTRTLDRRMLALLADPRELRSAGPFGLDLNVASILAPEFLRFDATLPQGLRGHVTLGLLPGDLLSDLPAFLFARDFVRARGYRLLLRLDAADLMPVLPIKRLGLELLQLQWSRALLLLDLTRIELAANRVLLAGADTAEALTWGRVHGVRLFAGRAAAPSRSDTGFAVTAT